MCVHFWGTLCIYPHFTSYEVDTVIYFIISILPHMNSLAIYGNFIPLQDEQPKPIWPSEIKAAACFFGFWVRERGTSVFSPSRYIQG